MSIAGENKLRSGFLFIGLLLLTSLQCSYCADVSESSDSQTVSYTYTVWVGASVNESYSLSLESPKGINFYEAMVQAAKVDPKFEFEAEITGFGHYISSINGISHDPENEKYWFIYILPEFPDVNNKPGVDLLSPYGVDYIIVEDGANYLFWYQYLDYQ